MVLAWLLLWSGSVAAHPFSAALFGHRSSVLVAGDRVAIDYRLEVPIRQVLRELEETGTPPDTYAEARIAELVDGLRLEVDGEDLTWTRGPEPEDAASAGQRFFSFHLQLEAPLAEAEGRRRLKVTDQNFPDERAFHYVEVWVEDGVQVLASSLFDQVDGEVRNLREARWRMEEESRVTELVLDVGEPGPIDVLGRRLLGEEPGPRLAHEALARGPLQTWLTGRLDPGLAVGVLLLGGLLGALEPARLSRKRAGSAFAVTLLGVALLLLVARFAPEAVRLWIEVAAGAGLALLAGLAWWGRHRPQTAWAALLLAVATLRPVLGLAVLVLHGLVLVSVGVLRRQGADREPVRGRVPGLAALLSLLAVAVLLHGLGALGVLP